MCPIDGTAPDVDQRRDDLVGARHLRRHGHGDEVPPRRVGDAADQLRVAGEHVRGVLRTAAVPPTGTGPRGGCRRSRPRPPGRRAARSASSSTSRRGRDQRRDQARGAVPAVLVDRPLRVGGVDRVREARAAAAVAVQVDQARQDRRVARGRELPSRAAGRRPGPPRRCVAPSTTTTPSSSTPRGVTSRPRRTRGVSVLTAQSFPMGGPLPAASRPRPGGRARARSTTARHPLRPPPRPRRRARTSRRPSSRPPASRTA